MSLEFYEKQQALLELYQKLGEAEAENHSGTMGLSHAELMDNLRNRVNEKI